MKSNNSILMVLICFSLGIFLSNLLYNELYQEKSIKKESVISLNAEQTFSDIPWLTNSEFNSTDSWQLVQGGDIRDINGEINNQEANYIINGDKGDLILDSPLNATDWTVYNNPDLPILPDSYEINSAGAQVSHFWNENVNQTRNRPSVHWKRNITLPVNMSDYVITSASLEVLFNATVTVSPHSGGGIDRQGDVGLDDYSSGDYADFYVLLADQEEKFDPIQVAFNRTSDLGQDSPPVPSYPDTSLNTVPESVLISALSTVLESNHYNFTIILGIDIYCEDNEIGVDQDNWNSLIIRNINLSFTYEKKIDQFTNAAWTQTAKEISGSNVQVISAFINFDNKINSSWASDLSPNSEIRIYIMNNQLEDTVKLTTLTNTFSRVDYDVTNYIRPYENITVAIQVFLADEFLLENDYEISIDNVYLTITYKTFVQDFISEPELARILFILTLTGAAVLGSYFIAYQKYLKYPIPVRKVRRYKRTLDKEGEIRVNVSDRKSSFNAAYQKLILKSEKFLKGKSYEAKLIPESIKKINPDGGQN